MGTCRISGIGLAGHVRESEAAAGPNVTVKTPPVICPYSVLCPVIDIAHVLVDALVVRSFWWWVDQEAHHFLDGHILRQADDATHIAMRLKVIIYSSTIFRLK